MPAHIKGLLKKDTYYMVTLTLFAERVTHLFKFFLFKRRVTELSNVNVALLICKCVQCASSSCAAVGFLWELWFPSTGLGHAC